MVKLRNVYNNCPSCNNVKVRKTISCDNINVDLVESWINTHKNRFFLPYKVCSNCSLYYVEKYFSENDLNFLYKKLKDNNFAENEDAHIRTQNSYLKLVTKHFKNKKNCEIIEYGPDLGILSEEIQSYYNPIKYHLVEPNASLHTTLKKINNAKIYENDNFIKNLKDESIDLIVMIHVFDHILNPFEKINFLQKKLKPSGKIFLVTHNTGSLLRFVQNKNWPPFCLHHPQLYNKSSLRMLLKRSKFKYVNFSSTYNFFPFGMYLNGLLSLLKIKTNFKFGPNIKLPVGNIATIATK